MRFIGLRAVAAGVEVLTLGIAVILVVEVPVLVENFSKGERYFFTGFGVRQAKRRISGQILPEIKHFFSFRGDDQLNRG